MNVKVTQTINSLSGKPIMDKTDEGDVPATLRSVIISALMLNTNEKIIGEEKLRRWLLAQRIYQAVECVDLTVEEIVLIKQVVGSIFGPSVVGPVFTLLT
jgi:hypothetical protein